LLLIEHTWNYDDDTASPKRFSGTGLQSNTHVRCKKNNGFLDFCSGICGSKFEKKDIPTQIPKITPTNPQNKSKKWMGNPKNVNWMQKRPEIHRNSTKSAIFHG
jgi:hypothetical protein